MSTVQALPALSDAAARDGIARVQAQAVQRDVCHLGKSIRWRRFGDGGPLLLLHGGYGSWMHWLRNVEALAQRHTVWVPDMPGFNDSDGLDPVPHGQDRMASLIDALSPALAPVWPGWLSSGRGTCLGPNRGHKNGRPCSIQDIYLR